MAIQSRHEAVVETGTYVFQILPPWWQWAALFMVFFLAYQLALPLFSTRPYADFPPTGMDSYRISMEKLGRHPMAKYQTSKHPLFVAIAAPLYHAARPVYRVFPEPMAENLALTFPVALLGALNACIAVALFLTIGLRGLAALLATIFYAGSASISSFASFPDSYICTTLFTNLFLFFYIQDPGLNRPWLLAFLNALACFAAPQQFLLAMIPLGWLLWTKAFRSVTRWVQFAGWLVLLYAVPYLLFLRVVGTAQLMAHEPGRWASSDNLIDPQMWLFVATTFLALAVAVPVPPRLFETLSLQSLLSYSLVCIVLAAVIVYAIGGMVYGRPLRRLSILPGLVPYYFAYLLFFVWWTPTEAFLYSAPILMPLWLLFHSGWVEHQRKRWWLAVLGVACILTVAGSLTFIYRMRDLATAPYRVYQLFPDSEVVGDLLPREGSGTRAGADR